MFNYLDPTNAQLAEISLYGKEKGKTSVGRCFFSSPTTLELYGSLKEGNYISQYLKSDFSKESYFKLGMGKLQKIRAFSLKGITLPASYFLNVPYYGGHGLLGTPEQENLLQESNELSYRYHSLIFDKIKSFYPQIVGTSVLRGIISSSKETSPTDYSCFYPYSTLSLYLDPVIFNCFIYRSGILLILGYQVFEGEFDFNQGISNIEDSFESTSL